MNRTDASTLGQTIAKTWRGGPHPDVWAEELEELHHGQAQAAYHQLRKTEEHGPTIARFLAQYHSLTSGDDEKVNCPRCDGGGFVEQEPVKHTSHCATQPGCHCSAVVPCDCRAGKQREAAFTRIASRKPA